MEPSSLTLTLETLTRRRFRDKGLNALMKFERCSMQWQRQPCHYIDVILTLPMTR